jgi:hypothetical protein
MTATIPLHGAGYAGRGMSGREYRGGRRGVGHLYTSALSLAPAHALHMQNIGGAEDTSITTSKPTFTGCQGLPGRYTPQALYPGKCSISQRLRFFQTSYDSATGDPGLV